MRSVLRLAPALLMILLCASSAKPAAQDPDISSPSILLGRNRAARFFIRGNVRDASANSSLGGVKVDLHQLGGATLATAITGSNGDFVFNDVGTGDYSIAVEVAGYDRVEQEVTVEDSVFGLQISLRKANGAQGRSAGPTVSVRDLTIPRKAHEFMQKGVILLYEKRDYQGSVAQFQRAIKEYPAYYEAYAQMGEAYMKLNDAASSEQALRKSIDVSDQHYPDAYFVLASLYVNQKRFADAEALARKGAELDDDSWKGHFALATALYGLERYAEAETEAVAASQLKPDETETELLLANIHIQLHKYPAVLEDLDTYLKMDPNGPRADQARHLRDQVQTALEKAQAAGVDSERVDAPSDASDSPDSPDSNSKAAAHQGSDTETH